MAGKVESVLHAMNSTFSRAKYAVAMASLLQIGECNAVIQMQETSVWCFRAQNFARKPVSEARIKAYYNGSD